MKHLIGLILLIAPWIIFASFALQRGSASQFAIVLTLAASALGLMILIGRKPKK
jgi:hypothetical protein